MRLAAVRMYYSTVCQPQRSGTAWQQKRASGLDAAACSSAFSSTGVLSGRHLSALLIRAAPATAVLATAAPTAPVVTTPDGPTSTNGTSTTSSGRRHLGADVPARAIVPSVFMGIDADLNGAVALVECDLTEGQADMLDAKTNRISGPTGTDALVRPPIRIMTVLSCGHYNGALTICQLTC